jgi:hypothetical protein
MAISGAGLARGLATQRDRVRHGLSVPKWVRKGTVAILMIATAQLVVSLSECGHPEHVPMGAAARVATR